ncbi:GntR family transcriptional regulator [Devosia ginsengisoli]|uniref:GntR family transcriptional regulator n=1 Tax=Devosia ginsengisoli TaxID=400770 RepID=A0A5B8LWN3_9HYPH|nr:GntR family transcriptional regulator [Devosia ginsengisoli]QDZ12747.1 GntR family transcriptional regulator [Devosia ginsengisoli]
MIASDRDEPELISDAAYAAIQNLIVTGRLRGGSMISENELREQLNCGRTPIREALQRLKLEGFVEIHPRRGVLVTTIDIRQQLELLEVRRPLEDTMVRLAARRATPEQRQQMRQLADELEAAVSRDDRDKYFGINRATHEIEAEATKNSMLIKTVRQVHTLSRRFWYSFITASDSFAEAAVFHCGVLRSIAEGDGDAAAANAGKLMDYLERVTREAIERALD